MSCQEGQDLAFQGGNIKTEVEICSVCAWRATCQKKFSVSGKDMRCTDFVKDISFKESSDRKEEREGMQK